MGDTDPDREEEFTDHLREERRRDIDISPSVVVSITLFVAFLVIAILLQEWGA